MDPFDGVDEVAGGRPAFQADWEDVVRRYGGLLHVQVHLAVRRAGLRADRQQVEDWMQEIYCRLLTGGGPRLWRLRNWNAAQVVRYLARVADGVVIDEKRSQAAIKRGRGFRICPGGRLLEIADTTVDPRANPEEEALRGEQLRLLRDGCHALVDAGLGAADRRRRVRILQRVFLEGWSSREVVQAEGGRIAPSSVHGLVHRARRRLAASACQRTREL
jgi:hypothetical protein